VVGVRTEVRGVGGAQRDPGFGLAFEVPWVWPGREGFAASTSAFWLEAAPATAAGPGMCADLGRRLVWLEVMLTMGC
jgi:hypothetical protein